MSIKWFDDLVKQTLNEELRYAGLEWDRVHRIPITPKLLIDSFKLDASMVKDRFIEPTLRIHSIHNKPSIGGYVVLIWDGKEDGFRREFAMDSLMLNQRSPTVEESVRDFIRLAIMEFKELEEQSE